MGLVVAAPIVLVLDTSSLLSGHPIPPDAAAYAPQRILQELTPGGRDRRALDFRLEVGLRLVEPTPAARSRAEDAAERTGDARLLSEIDLEVLAVALDVGGTILTDDYRIQNVASSLGVAFRGLLQEGIRETWEWIWRCRGCGRLYAAAASECGVCGSEVKAVRARPGQRAALTSGGSKPKAPRRP